jgi:hypothetical protein
VKIRIAAVSKFPNPEVACNKKLAYSNQRRILDTSRKRENVRND